ncbi:hypothetical protein N7456_008140 [Penicillium angulare]|uniref:Ubiquitin-like domain-containing protein n=1 Tax=Penicillium angulare TaxID=116970 RepID=A0A9W9FC30_9EURO|nr:hypothetical protein N7456_008140 [Penicillium angulare]
MGCCASIQSRDNHDISQDSPSSTQEHIAQPDQHDSNPPPRRTTNLPLDQHYNTPVRPHIWSSKRRSWTRADLDRERTEFFDTRVTGRPEIWAALSTAISLLQEGETATAQSIIDAAGVTVPTGDLCEGCYDEHGVLYRLPQCIVSDPSNMVEESRARSKQAVDSGQEDGLSDGKLAVDDASGDELIQSTADVERRRDEKGKTRERDLIRVVARLSDGGPDLVLLVGKSQSVGFLARKVQEKADVPMHQQVRIAYLGHMLKENESLVDQGWQAGHVINALVAFQSSRS